MQISKYFTMTMPGECFIYLSALLDHRRVHASTSLDIYNARLFVCEFSGRKGRYLFYPSFFFFLLDLFSTEIAFWYRALTDVTWCV